MLVPMGSKLGHTGLLGRPRLRLGTCAGPTGLQLAPHLDGLPPPDQLKLPVHAPVPLEALLQHLGGQGGAGPAQRGGVWQHVGAWVQIMVRACAWGGTEALASCHSGPRHSLAYVPMCIRAHIQRVRMAAHQLACCMPQAEPRCSVLAVPMQCSSERTHGTHATRALACMRRVRACVCACLHGTAPFTHRNASRGVPVDTCASMAARQSMPSCDAGSRRSTRSNSCSTRTARLRCSVSRRPWPSMSGVWNCRMLTTGCHCTGKGHSSRPRTSSGSCAGSTGWFRGALEANIRADGAGGAPPAAQPQPTPSSGSGSAGGGA